MKAIMIGDYVYFNEGQMDGIVMCESEKDVFNIEMNWGSGGGNVDVYAKDIEIANCEAPQQYANTINYLKQNGLIK